MVNIEAGVVESRVEVDVEARVFVVRRFTPQPVVIDCSRPVVVINFLRQGATSLNAVSPDPIYLNGGRTAVA